MSNIIRHNFEEYAQLFNIAQDTSAPAKMYSGHHQNNGSVGHQASPSVPLGP